VEAVATSVPSDRSIFAASRLCERISRRGDRPRGGHAAGPRGALRPEAPEEEV